MALPLPQGKNFIITHRKLSGDFEMPSMEVASDHYSLGFIIHGDRKIITPAMTYILHAGYINAIAPYLYHRTIPASKGYYESYLISTLFNAANGKNIRKNTIANQKKEKPSYDVDKIARRTLDKYKNLNKSEPSYDLAEIEQQSFDLYKGL